MTRGENRLSEHSGKQNEDVEGDHLQLQEAGKKHIYEEMQFAASAAAIERGLGPTWKLGAMEEITAASVDA